MRMRAPRSLVICALLAATVSLAPTAYGQAPPTNERRSAEAVFKSGLESIQKGDYETARAEFTYVYEHAPKPEALLNLALSELKSGHHPLEALEHFRTYAADPSVPTAKVERAKKHIDELYALTGHITIHANDKAALLVDGKSVPFQADRPLDVLAGTRTIEGRVGGRSRTVTVEAVAGAVVDADVRVDETPPAPVVSAPLPPPPTVNDLMLPPPKTETTTGFSWSTGKTVAVVLAGGAVVAFGAGVIFGAGASSNSNHAASDRANLPAGGCANSSAAVCQDLSQSIDAESRDHTLSGVAVGTGIVLAAGAVASWFFWPSPAASAKTSISVAPAVGPQGFGLRLGGNF